MTWYEHVEDQLLQKSEYRSVFSMFLCLASFVYYAYSHKTDDLMI